MVFHHLGCLVKDINKSIEHYRVLLGKEVFCSKVYDIKEQKVKVCFLQLNKGIYLELVEPDKDNNTLLKMLTKKKVSYYHTAFKVPDLDAKVTNLLANDYHLVTSFLSEAFGGKRCAFLYTPEFHLVELIEE